MFSKELSDSILRICESQQLSYEAASELCDLSPRYFGSIARGQTAPSINTPEKICVSPSSPLSGQQGASVTPQRRSVLPAFWSLAR